MGKIPKGLSDKDMLDGYVEDVTMEAQFLAAEAAEDTKRREKLFGKKGNSLSMSGLDDETLDKLGRKLLELKMELFREGIKNYTLKVKRENWDIIITPVIKGKSVK
ncbi:hypothetical protein [Anaerovibrio sp.]|uniref:hypothetical protein n=1 Tax=Anaerovibrio sp. TaxID=1872532 RepID=UPI0025C6940F|nr:hypothetical protein [Anaerovibrio sp.]MBR2143667.1 hypothetical protein [Anaerovibrio sp.]